MKTLVTGATGNTCSILIPELLNAGHEVRAFVRNEKKATHLLKAGAEIHVGNLDDPETIDEALRGIDQVYFCIWNGPTASSQGRNVIDAIKRTGTTPIVVRHSAFGDKRSRIIQQIDEVDEALKNSGLPWIFLRPTFFMQNLLMARQTILSGGKIYWDWNGGKVAMIDVRDIADSAVGALSGKAKVGQEYILLGPEPVSMHEVARSFSKVLGKQIDYIPVTHEAAKEAMMAMGFPEFIVDGYMELNVGFANGIADTTNENVEMLSGHPARSVNDFIRDFKGFFVELETDKINT